MMRISFFFSIRVCLFVLCHLLLYLGPGKGDDLPMFDGMIVSSACLLIIACTWLMWEMSKLFHGYLCSSSFSFQDPITLPAHATWFVWYYGHATVALIVFVFAYSILALSTQPPLTLCICIVASLVTDHGSCFFLHIVWLATMLLCLFFSMLDVTLHHANNNEPPYHSIFFGFFLPIASVGLLHYLLPHIREAKLTSTDLIKLTLPSLAMLSALFLSVTHPQASTTTTTINGTSIGELEGFYYAQSVGWLYPHDNTTNSTPPTANATALSLGHLISQFLHVWQNDTSVAPTFLITNASALSVLATLLCPGILWLLLNIFLTSFHTITQTQSNVTAFVFANLLRRMIFHGVGSWLRVFSFLLVVGGSLITLLYSYNTSLSTKGTEDDEQELFTIHQVDEPNINDSMDVDTSAT